MADAPRNAPLCIANWPRKSAFPQSPVSVYTPRTVICRQPDGPNWATADTTASPGVARFGWLELALGRAVASLDRRRGSGGRGPVVKSPSLSSPAVGVNSSLFHAAHRPAHSIATGIRRFTPQWQHKGSGFPMPCRAYQMMCLPGSFQPHSDRSHLSLAVQRPAEDLAADRKSGAHTITPRNGQPRRGSVTARMCAARYRGSHTVFQSFTLDRGNCNPMSEQKKRRMTSCGEPLLRPETGRHGHSPGRELTDDPLTSGNRTRSPIGERWHGRRRPSVSPSAPAAHVN